MEGETQGPWDMQIADWFEYSLSLPSWVTLSTSFLRSSISSFENLAEQCQVTGLLQSFNEILKMKPRVGHMVKACLKGG